MIFLDQPRDFLLRDLAPNVSLGRINQELRHAQKIAILQADGEAPIARPLPERPAAQGAATSLWLFQSMPAFSPAFPM